MDIAKFSIDKKVITWLIVFLLIAGGLSAFSTLGRLEDPEFTIKTAMVFTPYPGATPEEVEEEVSDRVEMAIQKLQYIDEITSKSYPGMSEITVDIKPKYKKDDLPQIWDELRRKVNDVQRELPPGTLPSIVNDDFGDVYGIFYAITGDGYSYKELKEYAKFLRKELLLVNNVAKVSIAGAQEEQIFVEFSQARLSQLGISPRVIYQTLRSQNLVSPSGKVLVGDEQIRITPTGELDTVEAIGDLVIQKLGSDRLIYLKDIATISRGYEEVPTHIIRFNKQPALTLGISIASGGNIVELGKAIDTKLKTLEDNTPAGLQITQIYHQPTYVDQSVKNFVVSLLQALGIVLIVLLFAMGLRSGMIIGAILLLSILGTFIFMQLFHIDLQRISLGALIIALGMLVDNAIVVAEGILVRVQQGGDAKQAASNIVKQTMWPLFGATVVGILAFAPIGLSDDSTGEFCASLFYVILISLMLSWFLAITVTPLFCTKLLKPGKNIKADPYDTKFYRMYKNFLCLCLKAKWMTVGVMIGLLVLSIYGFGFIKQSFFPDSMTPMFFVDYWRAQGTDIRATSRDMETIEKYISSLDGIDSVTSFVGKGSTRFTLTYTPEQPNTSYGQFSIKVKTYKQITSLSKNIINYIQENFPNSETKTKFIRLGPGRDAKIEVRFLGEDPLVLRQLANKAKNIMYKSGEAINIKDDWRQRVKVLQPDYSDTKARMTGISRSILKRALQTNFSGQQVGIYREGDELLPIVTRPPADERLNVSSINNMQIWSPILQGTVPIEQIVNGFNTVWEDQLVRRQNRKRTITASCDPSTMNANDLFNVLRPQIEAITLPTGYELEWGGEYEDATDAQAALGKQLPKGFFAMIIVVILLFNALKQPIIIWLTVPLAIIGVTAGLLGTGQPFGFMALLGLLSLVGMLIKNAIVLINQIDLEIREGKDRFNAVVDSAVARARPVSLAAATTVLGVIPLLPDIFFSSMAVTIMAGLTFATVLTLIFVPVLYVIFFRIRKSV